jgi:cytochrome c
MKSTLVLGIASAALLAMAACSKSEPAAPAAPPPEPAAPAPAPAAAPAAPAAPAATMIPLDIKDPTTGAAVSGDPVEGAVIFQQCMTCHSKDPGVNKVGPSLHGIINRHSGMIPNFNYSTANKGSGIVWTEQELYAYLQNPQKVVPGTYMTFTGVKDDQKRADVIAFLQENTK